MKYLLLILLCIAATLPACTQTGALTVVIIRHGEKNEETGNLSCKGLHRALLLPHTLTGKFRQFSSIYVPTLNTGTSTGHARMFQTITPLAVQNNLPVNSKYAVDATTDVAKAVMKQTGVVLLAWEHQNIPDIARALGVKDKDLHWNDNDYDSIWVITYSNSKKGNLKAVLTVDKEGLNPPDACNF